MFWLLALMICCVFALLAFVKKSLTFSGMMAAILVGTTILGGTGWSGFLVLTFFFLSSSGLGKWGAKHEVTQRMVQKGEQRDAFQVLANGGFASMAALMYTWVQDPVWLIVMCASLAAATADTWASAVGRWSKATPVHVLTGQRVEQGTSGAITPLGTWASFMGAALTAVAAIILLLQQSSELPMGFSLLVIFLTGWLGNWIDTLVGARWQVLYHCPHCQKDTEKEFCHTTTIQVKGLRWVNNEMVNALCTFSAGAFAYVMLTAYYFWQS